MFKQLTQVCNQTMMNPLRPMYIRLIIKNINTKYTKTFMRCKIYYFCRVFFLDPFADRRVKNLIPLYYETDHGLWL